MTKRNALTRAFGILVVFCSMVGATAPALGQAVAHLERRSGDFQIVVGANVPPEPYEVRALDALGRPVPGVALRIGPAALDGPWAADEFGFRGFNVPGEISYCALGCPPAEHTAVTDASGIARGRGGYLHQSPSAFLYGAIYLGGSRPVQTFFSVVLLSLAPPGRPAMAVEYFNVQTRRYFLTVNAAEIDKLDQGMFSGWQRSVGALVVYRSQAEAPSDAVPVCRLYNLQTGSHFHSPDAGECEAVVTRWPSSWMLESSEAFWTNLPDVASGSCGQAFQPVFRLYAERGGPTHRYVSDIALRKRMVEAGWIPEGYGPEGVAFCVPR